MSSNPYRPPESGGAWAAPVLPRNLGPVTLWTTIVFLSQAGFLFSIGLAGLFTGRRAAGDTGEMLWAPEFLLGLNALGLAVFWVPGIVLFCIWVRRANINADALVPP